MTRFQADALLLLATLFWGAGFVAQKHVYAVVGVFTFLSVRFALSALVVLPLAWREHRQGPAFGKALGRAGVFEFSGMCATFAVACAFQQAGVGITSVANAGFLTSLYVLMVPVICLVMYRQKVPLRIFPAALLSVAGVWLLSGGGGLTEINRGDVFVFLCAVTFAVQIVLLGRVTARVNMPFRICFLQYVFTALFAAVPMLMLETPSLPALQGVFWPLMYSAAISGAFAFTAQAIAQRYAPPSDAAVIMSAEAPFAALAGLWLLNETLTGVAIAGCALIFIAILTVELGTVKK